WPAGKDWCPDVTFSLVQADLLRGKSIGFLPTKVRTPDDKDQEKYGKVGLVIEEWILLEYACVFLPAQQNAVVEEVSKTLSPDYLRARGIKPKTLPPPPTLPDIPFTPLSEVEKALHRVLDEFDPWPLVERSVRLRFDRLRGRV